MQYVESSKLTNPDILEKVRTLNDLLKRQGKLNTETKDIKAIKKKLMNEIVPMVDDLEQNPSKSLEKKIDEERNRQAEIDNLKTKVNTDEYNKILSAHTSWEKYLNHTHNLDIILLHL